MKIFKEFITKTKGNINENFVYIFKDDFDIWIMKQLQIFDDKETLFSPLMLEENSLIKYIKYTDVLKFDSIEKLEEKYRNFLYELKNKIDSLKEKPEFYSNVSKENSNNDANADILFNWIQKSPIYQTLKSEMYINLLEKIIEIFSNFDRKPIEDIYKNEDIPNELKDPLFSTHCKIISGSSANEVFEECSKSEFQKKELLDL